VRFLALSETYGITRRDAVDFPVDVLRVDTQVRSTLKRTFRAVRIAATDSRIPRPLRWLAALGLAPFPGPFDEVLLIIVAVPLVLFYREPLLEAWRQAAE
jgi:hypothetical protein